MTRYSIWPTDEPRTPADAAAIVAADVQNLVDQARSLVAQGLDPLDAAAHVVLGARPKAVVGAAMLGIAAAVGQRDGGPLQLAN